MNNKISYSQSGEDLIIEFLFKNMLGIDQISYLDIGSNDPVDLNNTFFFYAQGHRGVCVDPNPLFKDKYSKKRSEDTFLSAGVGPKKGKLKFFEIDPHTLSTFSEETAKGYVRDDGHTISKIYKVPVITVDNILKKNFKKKPLPNLLSLDIEGWDEEILKSIDFNLWRPSVICIETITYSTKSEQVKVKSLFDFFDRNDYFSYADTFINTIFVDKKVWNNRR